MNARNKAEQSGYTLIELLLYVAMVSALLLAVTAFTGVAADARLKNQTISEVNDQGVYAMEYLTQTIRNADSVTLPVAAGSASSLTLAVPTTSLSPTVINLSGTALQVKEGTVTAVPLTGNNVQVTALTFKNLSRNSTPGIVQVSLTLTRTNTGGRNEFDYQRTFTTSVALRP